MSILENPEILKQHNNVVSNIGLKIPVWRTEYIIDPGRGFDSERKTAYIVAESCKLVQNVIRNNVQKGTPFQWECMPGLIVPEIHAFTPSLEKALYLYLKRKYEGPSKLDKAKKLMR